MSSFFIGNQVIRLESVDSTNNYAAKLLEDKNVAEGTAILAYDQYAGKGQRGNVWQSEKGLNLTFSIILKPKSLLSNTSYIINKTICLAIKDFVDQELNVDTQIKWPNDIYVEHQKIAGILIENVHRSGYIGSSIVGIGLNVSQLDFKLLPKATSLKKIRPDKSFEMDACFENLCKCIEYRYLQFKMGKEKIIREEYQKNLFQLNEFHPYEYKGQLMTARIVGVSRNGQLNLIDTYGNMINSENKEIIFL